MFEPLHLSHNQAVEWAIRSRDSVSKEQVVNHFLASLTTRRLDLRSALGSFAVARNLPAHTWTKPTSSTHSCRVCGIYELTDGPTDISVLNFERFKWGGVRHRNPIYIGFDLEEIAKQPSPRPPSEDRQVMMEILQTARSMPVEARLSDLEKTLSSAFQSNRQERRALIGILGYCGILVDPSKPSFLETFPHYYACAETPYWKDDWPCPVSWWRGSSGVVEKAVAFWFPSL